MKKLFFPAMVSVFLVSCGNNVEEAPKTDEPAAAVAEANFVSPIGYSARFEMGDPKKAEQVVQLWKDFDDNKLDTNKGFFADSVGMDLVGMSVQLPVDSMISSMSGYRSSLSAVKSKVDAVMSVKSTDKMEDWVLIWGTEYITGAAGKVDSSAIHEIWRFNTAGKVDYMAQYKRDLAPPKK